MRLVLLNLTQVSAKTSHRARGKQSVVRRRNQIDTRGRQRGYRNKARLGTHVVARKQIQPVELVRGHQPLNLIQHRQRIEGAELRFEPVRSKPHRVLIGLSRLRTARLSQIRAHSAFSERH